MNTIQARGLTACALLIVVAALAGCGGGGRTTVQGYTDDMLNRKRVMVLAPNVADITLSNVDGYAFTRGIAAEGAREQLATDIRISLVQGLGAKMDSNTVQYYTDQPIAGMVPLNATSDFPSKSPLSWSSVERIGKEGNVDYLLVLQQMTVSTTPSTTNRGAETITTDFILLDPNRRTIMATGRANATVDPLSSPGACFQQLAGALASRLPFVVSGN